MEQKAPRLSSASLVAGGMCMAFAILNGTADLAFTAGFSIEEIGSIGAGLVCFVISFFASKVVCPLKFNEIIITAPITTPPIASNV